MSILSDTLIRQLCFEKRMVWPFATSHLKKGISFGPSSYGYDIRLANEFKIPQVEAKRILDPKSSDSRLFREFKGKSCIIAANSFILARSLEYFKIPRHILGICVGKSTYARVGVLVNVTPLEPEWEGYLTIAISNTSPFPVKVYAREGIAQIIFFAASNACAVSYKDKKGKYQKQNKITLAKLK